MDQRAGEYLLDGPEHARQVSWWSSETKKQTSWHGMWFSPTANPDDTFSGNFDYDGRQDHARGKHFRVKALHALHGCQDLGFVGKNYMDRVILCVHIATHTYGNTGLEGKGDFISRLSSTP